MRRTNFSRPITGKNILENIFLLTRNKYRTHVTVQTHYDRTWNMFKPSNHHEFQIIVPFNVIIFFQLL